MATIPNTFSAQTPIGQSLQNIAQIMFAAQPPLPDPSDLARSRYYDAETALSQDELRRSREEAAARANLGDMASLFLPQTVTAPGPQPAMRTPVTTTQAPDYTGLAAQFFPQAMNAGYGASDAAGYFRALAANTGAPESAIASAFLGAGDAIGVNDAFSLGDRDYVAARNSALDTQRRLAEIGATPLSESQQIAAFLAEAYPGMSPRDQGTVLDIYSTPSMELLEGPGGELVSIDKNDPLGVLAATPAVGEGGDLSSIFDVTPLGGDEATATRQNLEAQARDLGITVEELQFALNVERRIGVDQFGLSQIGKLPPEEQAAYKAIQDKILVHQQSQPLPEGFSVIEP